MSNSVQPHRGQPTRLPRPWDSPGKNNGVGYHFLLQCMKLKSESEVAQSCQTLATPWTAAYQAPPSMGFSRQEYWSGVPLPSPFLHAPKSNSRAGENATGMHRGWVHAWLLLHWHRILGNHCPILCLWDPFCKVGTRALTFSWLNSIKSASELLKYEGQTQTSKCPAVSRLWKVLPAEKYCSLTDESNRFGQTLTSNQKLNAMIVTYHRFRSFVLLVLSNWNSHQTKLSGFR